MVSRTAKHPEEQSSATESPQLQKVVMIVTSLYCWLVNLSISKTRS